MVMVGELRASPDSEVPPTLQEISADTEIDHYRISRLLGRGGMGRVYLARDTLLGRRVVLKFMKPKVTRQQQGALRLLMEGRTTALFNHPNIVTIYGVGQYQDRVYLALEYLRGRSLRQTLMKSRLGTQELIRVGEAIALALVEAHRHQVLHLDLKPDNVFLTRDGQVKILDFGIAQRTEDLNDTTRAPSEPPDIRVEWLQGTPAYMAPEQWLRQNLTSATDIWALGGILYQLLTGTRPFESFENDLAELGQVVTSHEYPVAWPPGLESSELATMKTLAVECLQRDPELRPDADAVLRQLTALRQPSESIETKVDNPFRGLRPFTEQYGHCFFGRDREVDEIIERLREEPILPIVGASGVGKTSLVYAGVVPRLRLDPKWRVWTMRPGTSPFSTLADFFGDDPSFAHELSQYPERLSMHLERVARTSKVRILLVIDAFEELYTMIEDREVQRKFTVAILRAADDPLDPVRVLFTIRDDFLSRIARVAPEVRTSLRHMMLLETPGRDALVEIVTRPIENAEYRYETQDIVERMVSDIEHVTAGLPLLQFTMQALWFRRDPTQKQITQQAYHEVGGVAGALAQHADQVFGGMSPLECKIARQIFLRLVTPEKTRRALLLAEVVAGLPLQAQTVVDNLIESRLMSVRLDPVQDGESTVELAHEALIQTWDPLRRWVDASQQELRLIQELEQAARSWVQRDHPEEGLWTGRMLKDALRVRASQSAMVTPRVERFLTAARRQVKRRRFRTWSQGALVVLLMALAAWGWWGREAPSPACQDLAAKWEGVWDSAVAARLQAAFRKTEPVYAARAFGFVKAQVDQQLEAWLRIRRQACEAQDQTGPAVGSLREKQEFCLQRRKSQWRALIRVLIEVNEPALVRRAPVAASRIPPMSDCLQEDYLKASVRPPDDPSLRAAAAALQPRVDRLAVLTKARQHRAAIDLGEEILQDMHGFENHPLKARALRWLALARLDNGEHEKALEGFRDAVRVASRGKSLSEVALAVAQWAEALSNELGRTDEAKDRLEWLDSLVKLLPDSREKAVVLGNQGNILRDIQDMNEAKESYEIAIQILNANQDETMLKASLLLNSGLLYRFLGDYDEAVARMQGGIRLYEKLLGKDHPRLVASYQTYGVTLNDLERFEEAVEYFEAALAIERAKFPANHRKLCRHLDGLAAAYIMTGRFDQAQTMLDESHDIQLAHQVTVHPQYAQTISVFGWLFSEMQRFEEAKQKLQQSIEVYAKTLGPDHHLMAEPLKELALVHLREKNWAEAERLYTKSVRLLEKALGPEHPRLREPFLRLGQIRYHHQQWSEARARFERAAQGRPSRVRAEAELWLGRLHDQPFMPRSSACEYALRAYNYLSSKTHVSAVRLSKDAGRLVRDLDCGSRTAQTSTSTGDRSR